MKKNKKRRINDKTNPFYDHNYICCFTYGKPRSKDFHRKYYLKLLEDNNLPKIRFHDLRNAYSTLLLINNFDLKAVSKLLGYALTIITSNVYFDKNKIIIDYTNEMNSYIDRVKHKANLVDKNAILLDDLDMNVMVKRFLT